VGVTDLILAVVELLERDINRLVVEAWEASRAIGQGVAELHNVTRLV
jgi:hypothetical protein